MPTLTSVIAVPETVQTGAVADAKATVSPEVAVALSAGTPVPKTWSESAEKLIVCVVGVTEKCWLTAGAAA
jgi:hypothetical protein